VSAFAPDTGFSNSFDEAIIGPGVTPEGPGGRPGPIMQAKDGITRETLEQAFLKSWCDARHRRLLPQVGKIRFTVPSTLFALHQDFGGGQEHGGAAVVAHRHASARRTTNGVQTY